MEDREIDKQYVNYGEDDQMEMYPYRLNKVKLYFTFFGYILTCGISKLIFYWLPRLMLWSTHSKCPLPRAEKLLLLDKYHTYHVVTIQTITREGTGVKIKLPKKSAFKKEKSDLRPENDTSIIRYFICKRVKYIWDPSIQSYIPLRGLDVDYRQSFFHNTKGLTLSEQAKGLVLYGPNSIAIHVTPVIVLLFKEVLSPFYIFQLFSMCLWYSEDYWIYATCIFVMTTISILLQIYQTRQFERALRNTVASTNIHTVLRKGGTCEDIFSEKLVPGDVIEIPRHGCHMQCDAVLITGNCIVNESMLTGESVPVTKTPIPNTTGMKEENDPEVTIKTHSRHILFCGTHVIQTRFYGNQKVKAVVMRTGFSTSKGELVRSIMYPKPVDFKFQRHSYYYVMFLSFVALMGFIYTVILMVDKEELVSDIILRSLDLITIAIPPALPAALAVGIVFSQRRLKLKDIYCISPRGINVCGTINAVCFDKTGTITEEGLDMHGVVYVTNTKFNPLVKDMNHLPNNNMLYGMACCHSLTILNNEIIGDPMDLIMFHATEWVLEEPGADETRFDMMVPTIVKPSNKTLKDAEIGIVRQFPFSSSLQRMSVITRKLGAANFDLYVKGSPEMITSLSKLDTVPHDFHEVLQTYTQNGYRVIALAWKPLSSKINYVKIQRINREHVENDLTFLGLLVLENRLKPQSSTVICELKDADIRTVMITGDNMLTALSVARECKMVDSQESIIIVNAQPPKDGKTNVTLEFIYANDRNIKAQETISKHDHNIQILESDHHFHFALTGKTWAIIRQYCPDILEKIVVRGTVFARMAPDQKAQLVQVLQDVGYYVGMCGDGANDCGALKTAHMGISLSEAEASVASPFTSKIPTIECVPNVIKEGRAALVTSFGVFKYMACYSLTQFISVLILYWITANLTDPEFLYVDIFLITTFSITFSRTGPYDELVADRPLVSLLSPSPILSIVTQMLLVGAFQTFAYLYVKEQPWFIPFMDNDEEDYNCHENAAVFLISAYQYIILALVFAKGAPFRSSVFSNGWLIINFIVSLGITVWITVYPTETFAEFMELSILPSITYRIFFIGFAFIQFVLSYAVEKFIVDNDGLRHKISEGLKKSFHLQEQAYDRIENEIENDPNWPPVSEKKVNLAEMFQHLESLPESTEMLRNSLQDILDQGDDVITQDQDEMLLLARMPDAYQDEIREKSKAGVRNKAFVSHDINTQL